MSENALQKYDKEGVTNPMVAKAELLSQSDLVPKRFRGKTNNVLAMMQLAERSGMEPVSLMQMCYQVHGEFALETKAAIAMLASSGRIVGPPRYSFESKGNDIESSSCTCTVRDAQLNQDVSLTFKYRTAIKQGWVKGNPHWQNDPATMMRYRAAIQLIRSSYPDVLMGLYTIDEVREMQTVEGSYRAVVSDNSDLLDEDTSGEDGPPEVEAEPTEQGSQFRLANEKEEFEQYE